MLHVMTAPHPQPKHPSNVILIVFFVLCPPRLWDEIRNVHPKKYAYDSRFVVFCYVLYSRILPIYLLTLTNTPQKYSIIQCYEVLSIANERTMKNMGGGITRISHWGRDEMDAIFKTYSNAFFLIKIYNFWLRFHWTLFPRVQLPMFQNWFR